MTCSTSISWRGDLELGIAIATEGPRRVCIWPLPAYPRLTLALSFDQGFKVEGDSLMLTLTTVQRCKLTVAAVDAHGNPAEVDDVTFTASDPALLETAAVSDDPNSAWVTAVGPIGHAQVTVGADADLGEGVKPLQGILEVDIVAAEAVSLAVSAGTPEDAPITT